MGRRHRKDEEAVSLFSFLDIITCVTGLMCFIMLIMALDFVTRPPESEDVAEPPELARLRQEHDALLAQVAKLREAMRLQSDRLQALDPLALSRVPEKLDMSERRAQELAAEVVQLVAASQSAQEAAGKDGAAAAADNRRLVDLMARKEALESRLKDETLRNRLAFIPESSNGKRPILVQWSGSEIKVKPLQSQEAVQCFGNTADGVRDLKAWVRQRDANLEYLVVLLKPSGIASFGDDYGGLRELGMDLGLEPLEENKSGVF